MHAQDLLARRFEDRRPHLRAVAFRMLGSAAEADDAVQDAWFRYAAATDGAITDTIENLDGWLTTVVSRICLDRLRARAARREDPLDSAFGAAAADGDPEHEAVLIDSVGRALLVVLDTLGPDERVAFVLHDMFAIPFDQIAPIVGRTTATTKKLASRARVRARGESASDPEIGNHRAVVEAFLAAAREGDLSALLAVLAPDVVRTADPVALPAGMAAVVRGAQAVAKETVVLQRRSQFAVTALVDGAVGVLVAPHAKLALALRVTVLGNQISAYEVIADPRRLHTLDLAVIPDTATI
ncbi:sigma-70 family RNA polymerase sigma factor [Nocardia sp. NPDC127579]|uniref:sigma-70 family RNA polymerase sigma factor n=1 Tax=Nocardia sp. NPDC127579 TaxID=3345402 RepID=UPI00363766E4